MPTTEPQTRRFRFTPGCFVLALLAVECLLWLSERFGWLGWHKGYAVLTCIAGVGVAMVLMLAWFGVALVFRRQFQFSIRSLLVLVVVVALPCSWLAVELQKAKGQMKVVDELSNEGGGLLFDWEFDGSSSSLRNPEPPGLGWLRYWLGNEFFGDVVFVSIDPDLVNEGYYFTDDWLEQLRCLTRLKTWRIAYSSATNAGLAHLRGFMQLKELVLDGTPITDAGLVHIDGLRQLRDLSLSGTPITDGGLEHLKGLTQLERLCLYGTQVTNAGVAKLQQALPNCEIIR